MGTRYIMWSGQGQRYSTNIHISGLKGSLDVSACAKATPQADGSSSWPCLAAFLGASKQQTRLSSLRPGTAPVRRASYSQSHGAVTGAGPGALASFWRKASGLPEVGRGSPKPLAAGRLAALHLDARHQVSSKANQAASAPSSWGA